MAFLLCHTGCGCHGTVESEQQHELLCSQALQAGALQVGGTLEKLCAAVAILEESPSANCGIGSNLTIDGNVECDAMVMDSNGNFGCVSALTVSKYPCQVAKSLLDLSHVAQPMGRIPPCFLVGSGADTFAKKHNLSIENAQRILRTDTALTSHRYWLQQLHDWEQEPAQPQSLSQSKLDIAETIALPPSHAPTEPTCAEPKKKTPLRQHGGQPRHKLAKSNSADVSSVSSVRSSSSIPTTVIQDTVGCVVVDLDGTLSAGISSGGHLLKESGRVGLGGCPGAGLWVQQHPEQEMASACLTTGTGEPIMRSMIAKVIASKADTASRHLAMQEFISANSSTVFCVICVDAIRNAECVRCGESATQVRVIVWRCGGDIVLGTLQPHAPQEPVAALYSDKVADPAYSTSTAEWVTNLCTCTDAAVERTAPMATISHTTSQ
eukprot:m.80523 g.80523  ORF g.80523 m.80523 type:complete len:437 (-) comp12605_c0_seq2:3460-4770(-)